MDYQLARNRAASRGAKTFTHKNVRYTRIGHTNVYSKKKPGMVGGAGGRKYRPSGCPIESATKYKVGHVKKGRKGVEYVVIASGKSQRWKKKTNKHYRGKNKGRERPTPTLLQQMKSNPWMIEILKKKANNEPLSNYDKGLYDMMKSQPLPPGGITKLVKKYKRIKQAASKPSKTRGRKYRPSGCPIESATKYKIGHEKRGARGTRYVVIASGKSRRWKRKRRRAG